MIQIEFSTIIIIALIALIIGMALGITLGRPNYR